MSDSPTRPVNLKVLSGRSLHRIRPRIGGGAVVWRFTVLVPVEEIAAGRQPRSIATPADLRVLERCFIAHFRGVTIRHAEAGHGLRGKRVETNRSVPFVVYAAPVIDSERYFLALKAELEAALNQETILIERQEVWIA
jgi:hypothetical protein